MAEKHGPAQVDPAASGDWRNLGRVVVTLLKRWNLTEEQQLALLGTDPNDHAASSPYGIGAYPLPATPETVQRAAHLIAIHRSLRLLFPEDDALRFSWVVRRNQALGGFAPIDIMLGDGGDGIARVRALLDHQCMQ